MTGLLNDKRLLCNLTTMNDIVCSVLCVAVQHGERAHRGARHVRVLRAQRPGVRTLLLLRRLRDQGQNLLGDTEDTDQQQQPVNPLRYWRETA